MLRHDHNGAFTCRLGAGVVDAERHAIAAIFPPSKILAKEAPCAFERRRDKR